MFNVKGVNYLLTIFHYLLTRFIYLVSIKVFLLTRYAKSVYKFYFTTTVDFLIYFYACNLKRYMRLNYYFFTKITWLNRD